MIFVSIFSDITLLSTLFHCNAKQVSGKLLQLKGKVYLKLLLIFLKCYFFNDLLLLNFSHFHFKKNEKMIILQLTSANTFIHLISCCARNCYQGQNDPFLLRFVRTFQWDPVYLCVRTPSCNLKKSRDDNWSTTKIS